MFEKLESANIKIAADCFEYPTLFTGVLLTEMADWAGKWTNYK